MSRRPCRATQADIHRAIRADGYLTLDEAAAQLHCCGKTLSRFLRDNPADPPLYAKPGKDYIISPSDLTRIYEAMKQCRSDLSATNSGNSEGARR